MKIEFPGGPPAQGGVDVLRVIQQADVAVVVQADADAAIAFTLEARVADPDEKGVGQIGQGLKLLDGRTGGAGGIRKGVG